MTLYFTVQFIGLNMLIFTKNQLEKNSLHHFKNEGEGKACSIVETESNISYILLINSHKSKRLLKIETWCNCFPPAVRIAKFRPLREPIRNYAPFYHGPVQPYNKKLLTHVYVMRILILDHFIQY